VRAGCLAIARLGARFDAIGDYVAPLSAQLNHGTRAISESCKFCLLCIARRWPSRRLLAQFIAIAHARGPAHRAVAAEAPYLAVRSWGAEMVAACWAKLGATLERLLCDGSADTRLFARRATRSSRSF
jgi:hypothetical protein